VLREKLLLCAATAADAKNLNQRLRQVKAIRELPGYLFEIDEIAFDVLHRLAARTHQVMVRLEIAFHQERGSMRTDFPQQSVFHEQSQVLVNRSQGDGWSPPPDFGVYILRRIVSRRGHYSLIDDLPLMRGSQSTLPGQFPKLLMSRGHEE
jgi:hypothetical protein